ncbi:hypothetical protein Poli38472_000273 [Pythium oligandrum]|uniref:Trafficking protein particle complex subunit 6B n=1 Tax=Pythium oligandrum TaxID=41045 RepID=A0A8K1CBF4_PYTOL|nr:hypothetical protein Poli38472_000273 [Pythium oligandrum]|eukprot:TMW60231.1 hypothetical protein Poli38472_000273 [Pythium oligandrum]
MLNELLPEGSRNEDEGSIAKQAGKATMKDVAECCFQQLYGEIMRSMLAKYPLSTGTTGDNNEAGEAEIAKNRKEELTMKLEAMGYDVGYRFAERYGGAKDRPRMTEPLDVIKFVCKDFWILIFKKQIDKLQTNHRGVFVVQDYTFRWLSGFSSTNDQHTREMALLFLVFPCGLIRGALANLGITAIVNADVTALPGCLFNIKIKS